MADEMRARDIHGVEEARHEPRELDEPEAWQSAIGLAVSGQIQGHHGALLAQRIEIEEPVVEIAPEAVDEQHHGDGVALSGVPDANAPDVDELIGGRGGLLVLS